jgi:vacuolar-type H+-ATPase subunit I/STV1
MGHLSGIFGRWTYPIVIGVVVAMFVTGVINDLVGVAVSNAAALIPNLTFLVIVVGVLAVIVGVLLSIHKHDDHNAHGKHMVQRGLIAVVVGAVLAAGGLGTLYSATNAAFVKLEAKVQPNAAPIPAALKVTLPATVPAPAPTPITAGQR